MAPGALQQENSGSACQPYRQGLNVSLQVRQKMRSRSWGPFVRKDGQRLRAVPQCVTRIPNLGCHVAGKANDVCSHESHVQRMSHIAGACGQP